MTETDEATLRTTPDGAFVVRPVHSLAATVVAGAMAGASVKTDHETLRIGTAETNDLTLDDRTVSRFHLEARRVGPRVELTDLGSTNGTGIGRVRVQDATVDVELPVEVQLGGTTVRLEDGAFAMAETYAEDRYGALVGRTPAMAQLFTTMARVARTDASVLIRGESGTGKELVARAIHETSPRQAGPFVVLDCGAVTPSLLASELFGHERGAFTGADRRHSGVFERAQGGTLFLDEIGELPTDLQPALLGALERGRIRRVGGTEEVAVDARVLSATHRDLRGEVNQGTFRLDLYYRLAVVNVSVPPLRERRADVAMLIEHFAAQLGLETTAAALFDPATLAQLATHTWPGNVRELRNLVEAASVLGQAPPVEAPPDDGLGAAGAPDRIGQLLALPYRDARGALVSEFEARYVRSLLERAEWNVRKAARLADMNRSYLIELMKKHGLH